MADALIDQLNKRLQESDFDINTDLETDRYFTRDNNQSQVRRRYNRFIRRVKEKIAQDQPLSEVEKKIFLKNERIEFTVNKLTGNLGEIRVRPNATVGQVKRKIMKKFFPDLYRQYMLLRGKWNRYREMSKTFFRRVNEMILPDVPPHLRANMISYEQRRKFIRNNPDLSRFEDRLAEEVDESLQARELSKKLMRNIRLTINGVFPGYAEQYIIKFVNFDDTYNRIDVLFGTEISLFQGTNI